MFMRFLLVSCLFVVSTSAFAAQRYQLPDFYPAYRKDHPPPFVKINTQTKVQRSSYHLPPGQQVPDIFSPPVRASANARAQYAVDGFWFLYFPRWLHPNE